MGSSRDASCALPTTIGRRTGREHKVALPTWKNQDGDRIVVASFAGLLQTHRGLSKLERQAGQNPESKEVQIQNGKYWSDAQILDSG